MKIIQNLKQGEGISKKCTTEDIDKIVIPSIENIQQTCEQPLGDHTRGALAIAHCQLEEKNPLRYFVTVNGFAVVNPHISKKVGKPFQHSEGCMSFADKKCLRRVERYKKVIASFSQVFPDGKIIEQKEVEIEGRLALILQHEIDHMNGRHLW